jgi:hypothetical protein
MRRHGNGASQLVEGIGRRNEDVTAVADRERSRELACAPFRFRGRRRDDCAVIAVFGRVLNRIAGAFLEIPMRRKPPIR